MKITDRERKKYISEIQKLLVCSAKERRKFIRDFNSNIDDFVSDNPDADFSQLQKDMGTPQEIANAFLENESAFYIKKRVSFVKWIIIGIAITLILLISTLILELIDSHKSHYGHGREIITEESVEEELIEE